jgi:phosphoribosylaminoimidazolecarboxamide formyltransferase/IMP cyclohydrolase
VSFCDETGKQTLVYERTSWNIGGEERGLRYGENPDQQAALYKLVNGNLSLAGVECILPGNYLASDVEILQSGKHPGKTNITDVDSALNILRHLTDRPTTVVMKHNNPSGVASADTLETSYERAYMADRVAAFGGAVVVNRELDLATAERIAASYSEVVAAVDFEEGAIEKLASRKNLRVLRVKNIARLAEFATQRFIDFKSLIDGGMVAQWSQVPSVGPETFTRPAEVTRGGERVVIERAPTPAEQRDMAFGWKVEFGVTSNSVLYVKDEVTVGIGTGEQDRVGVAEIARDKAYRKLADRIAFTEYGTGLNQLEDEDAKQECVDRARRERGGVPGSVMVSDAFFPFRDGVDVGIAEGIRAVVQPGGSLRDREVIEACNEADVAMVFTGQRLFRH